MRLAAAMLCDAASVREGLLHVLGGGLTGSQRSVYPTLLGATLALQFIVDPSDFVAHEITVSVKEGTNEIARLILSMGTPEAQPDSDTGSLPIILPLNGVIIPAPGKYDLHVILDGDNLIALPLNMKAVS